MIKVAYDAGHGFNTPGKRTPDDEREWTFNDIVARAFALELSKYEGVASKRFDDPTGKTDVPLKTRTDGANSWGASYFISFHKNANTGKWGSWTGVETFIYTGNQPKSLALAKAIHPALVEAYGLRDRGIKQANLHIVRETKMPAILVEGPFMDSTIDIHKLRDRNTLENAGKKIAQAFAKFAGLKRSTSSSENIDNVKEVVEVNKPLEFLNNTGRKECKEMIKRGVTEKLFTSAHENLEKYSDTELISYSMAYLNRKTK